MSEEKTEVVITELRKRLKDDKDGSYRSKVLDQLDEASAFLSEKIGKGLSPEEFKALSTLKNSVDKGRSNVDMIWKVLQAS